MKNVYDIKKEKLLQYILPQTLDKSYNYLNLLAEKAAIISYMYYEDDVEYYCKYIENIVGKIDIYIITSNNQVIEKLMNVIVEKSWENIEIIKKPNVGRDISGLLIAAKPLVEKYEYLCFVHDKKAHDLTTERETIFWVENIWGNMIGSVDYINQIMGLLINNRKLGVLVPPAPVGEHFCTWYGYGWHGSFDVTKELVKRLKLNCDINEKKPPITIGTALWFKTQALEKLFFYPWKYEDFDDAKLSTSAYISYGVERIFAYVAQDAGYLTGEVMSVEYAQKQNLYLQYSMTEFFKYMQPYYPFPTLCNARHIDDNIMHMLDYAIQKERIYLYGAGQVGQFCLGILRKNGIQVSAFLISSSPKQKNVDGIDVIQIYTDMSIPKEEGVIVTVTDRLMQKQIKHTLDGANIDYIMFWEED